MERLMTVEIEDRKIQLLQALEDARARNVAAIESIDPELVIYGESGWRVKDLVAHVAVWENEVVTSIEAYNEQREYSIPGFTSDDDYNAEAFRQHRALPNEQVEAMWEAARERFENAIRAIPDDRFDGQIMCPWKKYSGIDGLVRDMVHHEAHHINDILSKVD
jgi:hypothetical protein